MTAITNQTHLTASPSCAICTAASALIRTGTNPWPSRIPESMARYSVQLGTVKEYTQSASTCPLCRTLLAHLHLVARDNTTKQVGYTFADDDLVELQYILFMGLWELVVVPDKRKTPFSARGELANVRFIRHVDNPESTACEKEVLAFVPPLWPVKEDGVGLESGFGPGVDFLRIGKWVGYCDGHHRGTCFGIEDVWKRVDPPSHLYFIDVHEECISWQPGDTKYVALSYVWGSDAEPLVSTMANTGRLCQPASLHASSALGRRLPRTLRDAMTATRQLGTRYLWVDRLCIVQDDAAHKPRQLAAMAAIYANASITLIAANGDDTCGLRLSPPNMSIITLPSNLKLLHDSPAPLLTLPPEPTLQSYQRRGWTLQEELLSPRTLKITPTEYTRRFLSYNSDAAHAFSAIVAAYGRAIAGGMLHGLSEILFEGALLWQPSRGSKLRRRSGCAAPSWSFLGWQGGGLDMGAWGVLYGSVARSRPHSEATHVSFPSRVQIIKCARFWKVDGKTGRRERVASGYEEEEAARQRRRDYEGYECWVPVLKAPRVVVDEGVTRWAGELVVETWIAEVRVGGGFSLDPDNASVDRTPVSSDGDREGGCEDIALLSDNGEVIGAIRPGGGVPSPGAKIPLILLSMGMASSPPIGWEMPELDLFHAQCPRPKLCALSWFSCGDGVKKLCVPYEFCNVMWVGWREEDGKKVAYREGLGRVMRKAWDGMEKDQVELLLG
ncbi:heterokaryon incompatibility protein-domain-containing protein [Podospora aff. communis PSN243]|uniref:Heterokaryon incompatibility protein-domain-containing protein n=1 Tax=Podospora aff. communis PSN243 TaxID=3040156 RepID=A0AAV9GAG7_9PEZI|nr:heterokaryon incompatibility protein-domain-containing protein [Podospora aff. communis PSN243]